MSTEDISENFSEFHHSKNIKFYNFGESEMKIVSPGLIYFSWKELCSRVKCRKFEHTT